MDLELTDVAFVVETYYQDPVKFCYDILNIDELDIWQEQFLNDFQTNNRIAIASCNSAGKTFILGCLAIWFLATRPDPLIVVTATTEGQLKNATMTTFQKIAKKSKITKWFKYAAMSIAVSGFEGSKSSQIVAIPNNENNPSGIQGLHADYFLQICDESTGISQPVWDALSGNLASHGGKWVAIGNPTQINTPFHNCFSENNRNIWLTRNINANDCKFVSKEWIAEQINTYGAESDVVAARCYGRFPTNDNSKNLFTPDVFNRCFEEKYPREVWENDKVVFGVDAATVGEDYTCITIRQGRKIHNFIKYQEPNTYKNAQKIVELYKEWNADQIIVDTTGGYGQGIVDGIRQLTNYGLVKEMNFSWRSDNTQDYKNMRCQMWNEGKKFMETGIDIPIAWKKDLGDELLQVEYFLNANGKIVIEDKKSQRKKNDGKSPDIADSLFLALYLKTGFKDISRKKSYGDPIRDYLEGFPRDFENGGNSSWMSR